MSRRYVLVEEERSLGCCNLVIMDALAVIVAAYYFISNIFDIHIVFRILMSLVPGIILMTLMRIKFLKTILRILFSAAWAIILTVLIIMFFFPNGDDLIWRWTLLIITFILSYGLHVAGSRELGDEENELSPHKPYSADTINNMRSQVSEQAVAEVALSRQKENDGIGDRVAALIEKENALLAEATELYSECDKDRVLLLVIKRNREKCDKIIAELKTIYNEFSMSTDLYQRAKAKSKMERMMQEIETEMKYVRDEVDKIYDEKGIGNAEIDEALFHGCDDMESLTKRYRILLEMYGDSEDESGNQEMLAKIEATYKHMRKK